MPQGPQVLVVDDSKFERAFLCGILAEEGWHVVGEAENGQEGVLKYARLRPDVVMMDLTMPVMDGLTAIKEIMKLDSEARVVVVTAMGSPAMFREALDSGAKDFIVKPFNQERVQEVLSHVLRG